MAAVSRCDWRTKHEHTQSAQSDVLSCVRKPAVPSRSVRWADPPPPSLWSSFTCPTRAATALLSVPKDEFVSFRLTCDEIIQQVLRLVLVWAWSSCFHAAPLGFIPLALWVSTPSPWTAERDTILTVCHHLSIHLPVDGDNIRWFPDFTYTQSSCAHSRAGLSLGGRRFSLFRELPRVVWLGHISVC